MRQWKPPKALRLQGPHVGDSTCLSSENLILNCWIFVAVITVVCASSPSHFLPLLNLCSFCEFNHSCGEAMQGWLRGCSHLSPSTIVSLSRIAHCSIVSLNRIAYCSFFLSSWTSWLWLPQEKKSLHKGFPG